MATRRIPRTAVRALFSSECRPQTHTTRLRFSPCQIRTLFDLPKLELHEHWEQHGVVARKPTPSSSTSSTPSSAAPGEEKEKSIRLYSAQGYRMAWTLHQSHLLYNLNYITMSDPESQTMDSLALAKRYARDPTQAVLFNYASQAHNNHFFFSSLSDRPAPLANFPGLHTNLVRSFGSVDNLRDLIRYTADGIFGCGYVWLVWSRGQHASGEWKVLATYNAGTPYVVRSDGSADRSQSRDMNNTSARTAGTFGNASIGGQAARERQLGGPIEIFPILCVSVWQHSYLRDWSVHGKRNYVDAWWECIDWNIVNNRTPGAAKEAKDYWQVKL